MNAHTVETVNINRVSWTLARGCHTPDSLKCCLLEVASLKAGELFGDKPGCVSPVLAAFGRALWDSTPDDQPLSELLPFADRLIGTAGRRDLDQVAGLMSADWAIRRFPVPWLRLAGLGSHADALETLPPLSTWDLVESAAGTTAAARDAAQDAARTAAGDAARTAAWAAAQAAARTAARTAAWAASGAAAQAAARTAAGDAAQAAAQTAARTAARAASGVAAQAAAWAASGVAARTAAWAAAQAAAQTAARTAAWAASGVAARTAAGDAAQAAAQTATMPTSAVLRSEAIDLFDRIIQFWEVW